MKFNIDYLPRRTLEFVAMVSCGALLIPAIGLCVLLVIAATVGAYLDLKRLRETDDCWKLWPDDLLQKYTIRVKTLGHWISPYDFLQAEIQKHVPQEK
jgi:hypothetical protein